MRLRALTAHFRAAVRTTHRSSPLGAELTGELTDRPPAVRCSMNAVKRLCNDWAATNREKPEFSMFAA